MSTLTSRYRGLGRLPRVGLSLVGGVGLVLMGLATGATSVGATPVEGVNSYVPLSSPCRILDTRFTSPISAGATLASQNLQGEVVDCYTPSGTVGSTYNLNADAVTSVVVNATVVSPSYFGYLSLYPTGAASTVSNLNFNENQTIANLVTVGLGTGGTFTVLDGQPSGNVQVVLDLEGYYTSTVAANTGYYVPLAPVRIADTRTGSGLYGAGLPIGPGDVINVPVAAAASTIPAAADISAVVINLTAVTPTAGTFLAAYAEGGLVPNASNLNPANGETVANRDIIQLGTGGAISIYNSLGTVDVIVDVDGYYTSGALPVSGIAGASLFTPLSTPARIADTRTGSGLPLAGKTLAANASQSVAAQGVDGISPFATALAANMTEVNSQGVGDFTAYPGGSVPNASDLNFVKGQIVPNFTQATLSSAGAFSIFNSNTGTADAFVDVYGFFAPASVGAISVTPTTPVTLSTASTRTYEATFTLDGANYTGNGLSGEDVVAFSDEIATPGTASTSKILAVETSNNADCWAIAAPDCPSTPGAEGAFGTVVGGATVSAAAYAPADGAADTYAFWDTGVAALYQVNVVVANNGVGGPAGNGLSSAAPEAYIGSAAAVGYSSSDPTGLGGTVTWAAPTASSVSLAVTNNTQGTTDAFTNGDYYSQVSALVNGVYTLTPKIVDQSGTAIESANVITGTITNSTPDQITLVATNGADGAIVLASTTVNAGGSTTYTDTTIAAGFALGTIQVEFTPAGPTSLTAVAPVTFSAQLNNAADTAPIGSSVTDTLNWVNAPIATDGVGGISIVAFDGTANAAVISSGTGAVWVIVNTSVDGPYAVQFENGNTFIVGVTGVVEQVFATDLATGETYTISNYGAAQVNTIS